MPIVAFNKYIYYHKPMHQTALPDYSRAVPLPVLIMVRGIPGSGKSYIARHLQDAIGTEKTIAVDPDKIDKESSSYRELVDNLTQQGVDAKLHPYRYLRAQAYQGITDHKAVIWNQAFTDFTGLERTIIRLQEFAAEHSITLPVLVIEVEVAPSVAKERVAARAKSGGHNVPSEAFARFIDQYQTFAGNGYPTITINGDANVEQSIKAILAKLNNL